MSSQGSIFVICFHNFPFVFNFFTAFLLFLFYLDLVVLLSSQTSYFIGKKCMMWTCYDRLSRLNITSSSEN